MSCKLNLCLSVAVALGALGLTLPATAHDGPRIYLDVNEGCILTMSGPDGAPPASPEPAPGLYDYSVKFRSPAEFAERISANRYLTEFPGFGPISTTEFAQSDQVGIRFLDAPKVWNGSGFVDTQATFRVLGTTPEYESVDFVVPEGPMAPGVNFFRIDNTRPTLPHGHLAYYLLGDGSNFVAGSDGIYELKAELTHTPGNASDPVIASGPPFAILFQVDTFADGDEQPTPFPHSDADFDAAFAVAHAPEPGGLAVFGIGAAALLRRRRHG